MAYCSAPQLFELGGMPPGGVRSMARLTTGAVVANNTILLDAHGLGAGDVVRLQAQQEGSVPSPLVALRPYYALPVDESSFQLEESVGSGAIDLTTTGSTFFAIVPPDYDGSIAWASALIDDMLPSATLPLTEPYPAVVVATCAELASWRLLSQQGAQASALSEILDASRRRLDRWARGVPVRGQNAPKPSNLSVSSGKLSASRRPWRQFGGL